MKSNIKEYLIIYYPVILAFVSFLYSVSLWFTGNKLEGIFVGIWVPSILALSSAIRIRRNDYYRQKRYNNQKRYYKSRNRKGKKS